MAMSEVVVAYIPVLHEGYVRFLESHGRGRPLFLIGPELYADYRPLAKDVRCLDAELVASAIAAWGICSEVSVLDEQGAMRLAQESPRITLPDEDVSHQVVDRFFARCEVRYDSVFLRWDKSRSVRLLASGGAATPARASPCTPTRRSPTSSPRRRRRRTRASTGGDRWAPRSASPTGRSRRPPTSTTRIV